MSEKLTVSLLMRLIDQVSGPATQVEQRVSKVTKSLKNLTHAAQISMGRGGLGRYKRLSEEQFGKAADLRLASEGISEVTDKIREFTSAPVEKAKEFQVAVTRLGVSATENADKFQELSNRVVGVAAGTTFTATEIAVSTRLLERAGMNTDTAISEMSSVVDYAEAHMMGLSQATEQVAGILRGFRLPASQVAHATDVISAAAKAGGMGAEEFGAELAGIAPTATALGVSMETAASTMALLGRAGLTGERGASALHAILTRLAAPRSIKRSQQVLGMIGVQALDANKNLRPLPELLGEIAEKTSGMGDAMKQRALGALFGREGAIAAAAFFEALKPGDIAKLTEEMQKASGITKRLADNLGVTAAEADERFATSITNLQTVMGGPLLPSMASFKNLLTGVITGATAWATKHPMLTGALSRSVHVIGVVAGSLAGLVSIMAATRTLRGVLYLATGYTKFGVALVKLGSAPMVGIARGIGRMVAGTATALAPLLAFAAAVTAVYLAVEELQKHWESLKFGQAGKGIWESIKEEGPLATAEKILDPTNYLVEHGWMEKPKTEGSKSGGARWLNAPTRTEVGGTLRIEIDINVNAKLKASIVRAAGVNIDMITAGRVMMTP